MKASLRILFLGVKWGRLTEQGLDKFQVPWTDGTVVIILHMVQGTSALQEGGAIKSPEQVAVTRQGDHNYNV